MKTDGAEEQLRPLFRDQRARDAARAPAFADLARAARPAPTWLAPRSVVWGRLAAVAALLAACAGLALFHARSRPAAPEWQAWAALAAWQPATDSLLPTTPAAWGALLDTPTDIWASSTILESDKVQNN